MCRPRFATGQAVAISLDLGLYASRMEIPTVASLLRNDGLEWTE